MGETTDAESVVAIEVVLRAQVAGVEVEVVGVRSGVNRGRPVKAVVGLVVQKASANVATAREVEGISSYTVKTTRIIADILVGLGSDGIGDVIGIEEFGEVARSAGPSHTFREAPAFGADGLGDGLVLSGN